MLIIVKEKPAPGNGFEVIDENVKLNLRKIGIGDGATRYVWLTSGTGVKVQEPEYDPVVGKVKRKLKLV